MKIQLLLVCAWLWIPFAMFAEQRGEAIGTITTNSGKTYHNCRVFKIDPDGVMFAHEKGGAKILFTDMPQTTRDRLGYDPQKEAAYANDLTEKRKQDREHERQLQLEWAKSMVMAQAAELKRLELPQEPSYSAVGPAFGYEYPLAWPYGGLEANGYGSYQNGHGWLRQESCRFGYGHPGSSTILRSNCSRTGNFINTRSIGCVPFVCPPARFFAVPAVGFAPPLASSPAHH